MIRFAKRSDIPQIIDIHKSSLKEDYLPQLGEKLILTFYDVFINVNPIFVFEKYRDIIGFLALSCNRVNFGKLLLRYPGTFLIKILSKPRLWPQTLWIALFSNSVDYQPEISFIAVQNSHSAHGVGSQLINFCSDYLRKDGKQKLFVKTDIDNLRANTFYKKNGFHIKATEIRFNRRLNIYLKNLV